MSTLILIKDTENFDKEKLLQAIAQIIKMSPSDTVRGSHSLRVVNDAIRDGSPFSEACGKRKSSLFSLRNNNGWLRYTVYGGPQSQFVNSKTVIL